MPFSKTDYYYNKPVVDYFGTDINEYEEISRMYMGADGDDML